MSCAAIIINYFTRCFVEPLVDDLCKEDVISQIIIIDNSKEFSEDYYRNNKKKRISIIANRENRGYGSAANQGIDIVKEDWVFIINPDIRFFPGCLDKMYFSAVSYDSSIVGPRFYLDFEKKFRMPPASGRCLWFDFANLTSDYYSLDSDIFSFYWSIRHDHFWAENEPFFEPFLSGAVLLIQKDKVANADGKVFDERFFLYFEDTDLCVRMLKSGETPLCIPQAEAVHFYDQSPSPDKNKNLLMEISKKKFFAKHYKNCILPQISNPLELEEMEDQRFLGKFHNSPMFRFKRDSFFPQKKYFEFGMNPYFVPFVQTEINDDYFSFPSDVWERLRPGKYYCRKRRKISGVSEVFKWEKI